MVNCYYVTRCCETARRRLFWLEPLPRRRQRLSHRHGRNVSTPEQFDGYRHAIPISHWGRMVRTWLCCAKDEGISTNRGLYAITVHSAVKNSSTRSGAFKVPTTVKPYGYKYNVPRLFLLPVGFARVVAYLERNFLLEVYSAIPEQLGPNYCRKGTTETPHSQQ